MKELVKKIALAFTAMLLVSWLQTGTPNFISALIAAALAFVIDRYVPIPGLSLGIALFISVLGLGVFSGIALMTAFGQALMVAGMFGILDWILLMAMGL